MVGEIIKTKSIAKGENLFKVVNDIRGPEAISVERLELVPLISKKIPSSLTFLEIADIKDEYRPYDLTCWDIRDRAKEMDAHFGLQHARCLLDMERKIPKEWHKYRLLFPETGLRDARNNELHIPVMISCDDEFFLFLLPVFRQTWDLRMNRFVRWHS